MESGGWRCSDAKSEVIWWEEMELRVKWLREWELDTNDCDSAGAQGRRGTS